MRVVCAMGSILLPFMAYAPADASYLMSGNTYVHNDRQQTHHVRAAVRSIVAYASNGTVQHPPGCPRYLFCGCAASARVFGHPVRSLYRVRNWYRFPHSASARRGGALRCAPRRNNRTVSRRRHRHTIRSELRGRAHPHTSCQDQRPSGRKSAGPAISGNHKPPA